MVRNLRPPARWLSLLAAQRQTWRSDGGHDLPDDLARTERAGHGEAADAVPWSLKVAAAWSWRLIAVVAALAVIGYGIYCIKIIVIPTFIALLLAVLLEPVLRLFMNVLRFPRTLAAALSLILGLCIVVGLMGVASRQIIANSPQLISSARDGVDAAIDWITRLPFQIDASAINQMWDQAQQTITTWLERNSRTLATGAVGALSSASTIFAGLLMCIFCLFFFLKDGRKMWQWVLRLCPVGVRSPLNEAAIRGWVTLGSYARTQMIVAAIDAVGIGIGAWALHVPMALPIAVLVFFASFVPIVGAVMTGALAVLIGLVTQGPGVAVGMLIVILVVQQVESHLLQPFLMSSAVSIHPVAVLLGVAGGSYLMGIAGAVFAVPVIAFVNAFILYLKGYDKHLRLNYDLDRPGGAPGILEEEMARAAKPDPANIKAARKARDKARERGQVRDAEDAAQAAQKASREVQRVLEDFDDAAAPPEIPSSAEVHLDGEDEPGRD